MLHRHSELMAELKRSLRRNFRDEKKFVNIRRLRQNKKKSNSEIENEIGQRSL